MDREQWLEERRSGIGGSEAAAVCGLSPWRTPYQVWEEKMGLGEPQPETTAMTWGKLLEPIIRQIYCEYTGQTVRLTLPEDPIRRHKQYPFMMANLDGFTDEGRVLEIKTDRYGHEWGDPGTDEIPLVYMLQVQHYMAVMSSPVADVAVLIGGNDFRIYEVLGHAELQTILIGKEQEFWRLVTEGKAPDPINYEDVRRRFPVSIGKTITATQAIVVHCEDLRSVKKQIADLEKLELTHKEQVMKFIGESESLCDVNGDTLVTWKSSKESSALDTNKLQKEQPELYKKYLVTKPGSRRFLLKG